MPERIEVGGAELVVHLWGPADGSPVLFWHPLGPVSSGLYGSELAAPLAAAGFRLVAPDGPGFGESPLLPAERYELPALVELVAGLLDRLGLRRAAFVGHSWGGFVGVHAAAAMPERIRALALLDSAYADPPEAPGEEELLCSRLRDSVLQYRETFLAVCRAALRECGSALVPVTSPEARVRGIGGIVAAPPTRAYPALAAARIPVLALVAGQPPDAEDGRLAGLERFTAAVPQAEIRRMHECGHDLIADAAPDVGTILAEWLARTMRG